MEEYTTNGDQLNQDHPRSFDEREARKLIREEMQRNYRPKSNWFRVLLLVLVGALLGGGVSTALLGTGAVTLPYMAMEDSKETEHQEVKIELNQDSTVENVVAKKATPSIVGITTLSQGASQNPFFYGYPKYTESVGSGVIVSKDGYIVTNSHVVDNGNAEKVNVLFSNGEEAPAKILWNDPTLDLAVIKVEKKDLQPISFGKSEEVSVGDKAIAIGNPLGLDLQSTLTSGYISGLNRSITLQGGNTMDGLIQTDAAINAGNSGGALLNAKGELIGLNTAKPMAADGIGFAIPISTIRTIVDKIVKEGSYEPLYLGITGLNVEIAKQMGAGELPVDKGVLIHEVIAGSPAGKAGLRPGDIITSIDDQPVESMNSLKTLLLNYEVGNQAKLEIYRGKNSQKLDLRFESFVPSKSN